MIFLSLLYEIPRLRVQGLWEAASICLRFLIHSPCPRCKVDVSISLLQFICRAGGGLASLVALITPCYRENRKIQNHFKSFCFPVDVRLEVCRPENCVHPHLSESRGWFLSPWAHIPSTSLTSFWSSLSYLFPLGCHSEGMSPVKRNWAKTNWPEFPNKKTLFCFLISKLRSCSQQSMATWGISGTDCLKEQFLVVLGIKPRVLYLTHKCFITDSYTWAKKSTSFHVHLCPFYSKTKFLVGKDSLKCPHMAPMQSGA